MRVYFLCLVAAAAVACGGIAVVDPEPGSGGGGEGGASSSGGGGADATSTTSTGSGMVDFDIELASATVTNGCMPQIPPDPMSASLVLQVDNSAGSQAVEVSVGTVTLSGDPGETTFEVEPVGTSLVMAGSSAELTFEKTPDSAMGTPGCQWCNETNAQLSASVTAAGMSFTVAGTVDSISCSF